MKMLFSIFLSIISLQLLGQPSSDQSFQEEQNRRVWTADSLVLVDFYNATGGSEWTSSENWLSGLLETWEGIRINNEQGVDEINLPNNNITGDASELMRLDSLPLVNLYLNGNNISGTIPQFDFSIVFKEINLSHNQLSGVAPTFENLWNLDILDLSHNAIEEMSIIPSPTPSANFLEELRINNNRLTFEDVLKNTPSTYIYDNQDSVGTVESVDVINGGSHLIDLDIDNSLGCGAMENDYVWYYDGVAFDTSCNDFVIISSLTVGRSGVYTCEITNDLAPDLTLHSRPVTIDVTYPDSVNLVKLYNSYDGPNWVNATNWMNTPIANWEGITFDGQGGGHVEQIDLSGKNLTGPASALDQLSFENLQLLNLNENNISGELPNINGFTGFFQRLELSNNQLSGAVPNFDSFPFLINLDVSDNNIEELPAFTFLLTDSLNTLRIDGNQLTFEDVLNNTNVRFDYEYGNQDSIEILPDAVALVHGDDYIIDINIDDGILCGAGENTYLWKLDGLPFETECDNQLVLTSVTTAYNGTYICEVTNSLAPNLTIFSDPVTLAVTYPDSSELVRFYTIYNGPEWINADNWLVSPIDQWEGITLDVADRIIGIDLNSKNLSGPIDSLQNFDLPFLIDLDLSNNSLTGTLGTLRILPNGRRPFSSLKNLDISRNMILGNTIDFSGLPDLESANLRGNNVGGVPDFGGGSTNLISLDLGNNRINGAVPDFNMPNLSILKLDSNLIDFIPCFSNLPNLTVLHVHVNQVSFDDILCNETLVGEGEFLFCPQDSIGELGTVEQNVGGTFIIDLGIDELVETNIYIWSKDGIPLDTTTINTLVLTNITLDDAGVYTCEVPNTEETCLTLYSRPVTLIVHEVTGVQDQTDKFNIALFPVPFTDHIEVSFQLDVSGPVSIFLKDVMGRANGQFLYSEFLNAGHHQLSISIPASFSKGVYLFEFSTQDARTIRTIVKD